MTMPSADMDRSWTDDTASSTSSDHDFTSNSDTGSADTTPTDTALAGSPRDETTEKQSHGPSARGGFAPDVDQTAVRPFLPGSSAGGTYGSPRTATFAVECPCRPSPEQLDRLMIALANAPMLQRHVRQQWWDVPAEVIDHAVSPSEVFPDDNDVFSTAQQWYRPAQNLNPPSTFIDASSPQDQLITSISISDSKVAGCPVLFSTSSPGRQDPQKFGHCSFQTLPYGASSAATLCVAPPPPRDSGPSPPTKITLSVTSRILQRKTRRSIALLTADMDVTALVQQAALAELAATAVQDFPGQSTVDLDTALADMAFLGARTCTPATHALAAALSQARTRLAHFAVVQLHEQHGRRPGADPAARRASVPWTSQALARRMGHDGVAAADARAFREALVGLVSSGIPRPAAARAVGPEAARGSEGADDDGESFVARVPWPAAPGHRSVRCVPLSEGVAARGSTAVWVCFVGDGSGAG